MFDFVINLANKRSKSKRTQKEQDGLRSTRPFSGGLVPRADGKDVGCHVSHDSSGIVLPRPDRYDRKGVTEQLRYGGVLQAACRCQKHDMNCLSA